jgi:chaperonin GroEL
MNLKLKEVKLHHLGKAEKVSVSSTNTEIVNGYGKEEDIEKRIQQIEGAIEISVSDFDTKNLKERLAKLDSGVAIIKVGGKTEAEISEKKDRVDDAKCATIAALEEGYVAGGGTAFLHCLEEIRKIDFESEDEKIGAEIIREAIQYPFCQILTNAGLTPDDYLAKIAMKPYGWGINVRNNKEENLLETGVIDPTKVLRCSLENAASVAALFLTTECIVSENI